MGGEADEFTYQERCAITTSKFEAYYEHLEDLDDQTHSVLQHDYLQRRFLH
jgi:hypothetical protein